jgi:hypothetical protein
VKGNVKCACGHDPTTMTATCARAIRNTNLDIPIISS